MHMGSWGLMSYHNLMGIYQNRKGMIRFFIISHHHPMGRSIIKTFVSISWIRLMSICAWSLVVVVVMLPSKMGIMSTTKSSPMASLTGMPWMRFMGSWILGMMRFDKISVFKPHGSHKIPLGFKRFDNYLKSHESHQIPLDFIRFKS